MLSQSKLKIVWDNLCSEGDPIVRDRIWSKVMRTFRRRKAARTTLHAAAYFASCAAMLALGIFIQRHDTPLAPESNNTVEWVIAENGGQILPDGSAVWLDSGSKLSFNGDMQGERAVELDGSATFDIVHTPDSNPFFVKFNGSCIKVTGTKFSVREVQDTKINVTLFDGAVEFLPGNGQKGIRISPMQDLVFDTQSGDCKIRNLFTNITWSEGEYKLSNADLKELVAFISWRYDAKVSFRNVKDNTQKFNGYIAYNEPIESVIDKICYVLKLNHSDEGSKYLLYK